MGIGLFWGVILFGFLYIVGALFFSLVYFSFKLLWTKLFDSITPASELKIKLCIGSICVIILSVLTYIIVWLIVKSNPGYCRGAPILITTLVFLSGAFWLSCYGYPRESEDDDIDIRRWTFFND